MKIIDLIKIIAESFGLQITIMKYPYTEFELLDYGFRKKLVTEYDYEYMRKQIVEAMKPNTLLYLQDNFNVYYYAFALPREEGQLGGEYVFLGPFRYKMDSMAEVEELRKRIEILIRDLEEIKEYFELVPIVHDMAPLQTLLSSLFSQLYPEKGFDFVAANLKEPVSMYANPIVPPGNLEDEYTKVKIEKKYATLDLLIKNVCEGNTGVALKHLRFLLKFIEGDEDGKKLFYGKKLAEELNVLLNYQARRYKVHSLYCENIYEDFSARIKEVKFYAYLQDVLHEIVADYGQLIRERSRREYSYLIRDCVDYIDAHYAEALTLTSEAKRLSVSDSYLSNRFVKETGMNFVEYVNAVRIQYARMLLVQLQLPIQRIAELCGFTSSNYFARVFRQIEGETPREYRKKRQKAEKDTKNVSLLCGDAFLM